MDASAGSNSIFGKFSKLRKRPQQPLTDLTELYSKIANESIYYKKLEDLQNYKHALQGWKALTTDAMFQLTLIDNKFPNTEYYTVDELSLLSGVRELYHKAISNMEHIQKLLRDHPELNDLQADNSNNNNNRYHTRDHRAALQRRKPPAVSGYSSTSSSNGFVRTTLRDNSIHSYSLNNYSPSNSLTSSQQQHHNVKVNFSSSKPLQYNNHTNDNENDDYLYDQDNGYHKNNSFNNMESSVRSEQIYTTQSANSDLFDQFTDNGQVSEEEEKYESYDNSENPFQDEQYIGECEGGGGGGGDEEDTVSDADFDVSDYYNDFFEVDNSDLARLRSFDKLNGSVSKSGSSYNEKHLQDTISKLAVTSSSKSYENSNNNTPRPQLKQGYSSPHPLARVPVIVQPQQTAQKPKVIKKHNLLDKGSLNRPGSKPMTKQNKSTPSILTTTAASYKSAQKKQAYKTPKSAMSTPALLSKRPLQSTQSKSSTSHTTLQKAISPTQVAKLVYNAGGSGNNLLSEHGHHSHGNSNNTVKTGRKSPMKKAIDNKSNASSTAKTKRNIASSQSNKSSIASTTKNSSKKSVKPTKKRTTTPTPAPSPVQAANKSSSTKTSRRKHEEKLERKTTSERKSISEDEKEECSDEEEDENDKLLKTIPGIDKDLGKQILNEIVVHGDEVHWDDIAGLSAAKKSLKEAVVYPFLRPDLFMGLREPVTGMLLFGPPGTGKTMIARAVACESHSTFFSISASSLTSKYLGESEKLVRALFAIARKLSPSIIFVDEIDSILGSRNQDGENESSRRIKNEFLVQWSALSSAAAGKDKRASKFVDDKKVLVLAATNLPWSIDEAARRRFVRRQYIPLPEGEVRLVQIKKLLSHQKNTLTVEDYQELLKLTEGYSGSDITSLAKDAAMGPLRELGDQLLLTDRENIRPISLVDFKNSLEYIRPSVSEEGLEKYEEWAAKFGSSGT